jgi:hypothetical protein
MKTLTIEQMTNTRAGRWVDDVLNCMDDFYWHRGWSSIGLLICGAFCPETILIVGGSCALMTA